MPGKYQPEIQTALSCKWVLHRLQAWNAMLPRACGDSLCAQGMCKEGGHD